MNANAFHEKSGRSGELMRASRNGVQLQRETARFAQ
jgi:hypothetical protein